MSKIRNLKTFLNKKNLDAVNVKSIHNIFYLSGFTGTTAQLIITANNNYLLTDFRYTEQAKNQARDFKVMEVSNSLSYQEAINKIIKKEKIRTLGVEGSFVSRNGWLDMEKSINARLIDVDLEHLREIKTEQEIAKIQEAINIAEQALTQLYQDIKVGMSEKEVALMLEMNMKKQGASDLSFETIVASGVRGALPHGVASDKIIEANEFVTIDFGCVVDGYCSDITRTFVMGKEYNSELKKIYEIVKKANEIGHQHAKPGVKASEVDKAVRDYITEAGYGDHFGHGLGHGLGVLVHENPRLSPNDDTILKPGHVVTIEPGIYIDGLGGVRIEDDVLITETGSKSLTTISKDLQIIEEEE